MTQPSKFSVTSNTTKLLHHLDNLTAIRNGHPRPVLFHISPTNVCQLACKHCCFGNREKGEVMEFGPLLNFLEDIASIGVKVVEWAGGGEPTLYPFINEAIGKGHELGMRMGILSNGVSLDYIACPEYLQWIRLSLNYIDNPDGGYRSLSSSFLMSQLKTARGKTKVSACYVATEAYVENVKVAVDFAEDNKIVTRFAPDCTGSDEDIKRMTEKVKELVGVSDYAFVSDFNISLGARTDDACYMHFMKPFLFTDGWVYTCPSAELSTENRQTVQDEFRVCRMENVVDYYTQEHKEVRKHGCRYCRYRIQNEMIHSMLEEIDDAEFC